jgi:hypothetical protein
LLSRDGAIPGLLEEGNVDAERALDLIGAERDRWIGRAGLRRRFWRRVRSAWGVGDGLGVTVISRRAGRSRPGGNRDSMGAFSSDENERDAMGDSRPESMKDPV